MAASSKQSKRWRGSARRWVVGLVGLVLSVGVAWGSWWFDSEHIPPYLWAMASTSGMGVDAEVVGVRGRWGRSAVVYIRPGSVEIPTAYGTTLVDQELVASEIPYWSSLGDPPWSEQPATFAVVIDDGFGWPFRSMRSRVLGEEVEGSWIFRLEVITGFEMGESHNSWAGLPAVLPTQPIWGGLLANTLVFWLAGYFAALVLCRTQKSWLMKKASLRESALFVLVAMALNLVVAWSLAGSFDPLVSPLEPTLGDDMRSSAVWSRADQVWNVSMDQRPGVVVVDAYSPISVSPNAVPGRPLGYRWVAHELWEPSRRVVITGWPALSFSCVRDLEWVQGAQSLPEWHGGIDVSESMDTGVGVLPFRMYWPGFAANTIFYAGIFLATRRGMGSIWQCWRQRGGRVESAD